MHIVEVNNGALLREFINFPDELYRDCPQYVPALHSDQKKSLTSCASLKYCTHALWLAISDEGKTLGRISAIINPRYNELYRTKRCRFGWFDSINDIEVAKALIDTASSWASERGMTQIHGPLYYNTLGKQGMLVEGFDNIPQFNTIYNYPYYVELIEKLGFVKECDWLQYIMEGTELPSRLETITHRLMERHSLSFADMDTLKKDPAKVREFLKLYSDVFSQSVYNFIPFTEEEMDEEAAQSIAMISSRYCTLVVDSEGDIAGFAVTFPSISKALQKARGRLFPFGWIYLLRALYCKNDTVDLMINGCSPKWRGHGVSAIFHADLTRKLREAGVHYSISNPQIETNNAVNVWSTDYESRPFMRRRCYIRDI